MTTRICLAAAVSLLMTVVGAPFLLTLLGMIAVDAVVYPNE